MFTVSAQSMWWWHWESVIFTGLGYPSNALSVSQVIRRCCIVHTGGGLISDCWSTGTPHQGSPGCSWCWWFGQRWQRNGSSSTKKLNQEIGAPWKGVCWFKKKKEKTGEEKKEGGGSILCPPQFRLYSIQPPPFQPWPLQRLCSMDVAHDLHPV